MNKFRRRLASALHKNKIEQDWENWTKKSYSVCGEDLMIRSFLPSAKGFYLDIGAYHPIKYSNTYLFYTMGWRGVCIDPLGKFKREFELYRPNDILLHKAVGQSGQLNYYQYELSAYNTVSDERAKHVDSTKLLHVEKIEAEPLGRLLGSIYPEGKVFDFASVDVEGTELDILKSHDWDKFPISLICVEQNDLRVDKIAEYDICRYLTDLGYHLVAINYNNLFFKK